ncbi:hypothetical protein FSP39_002660 [Pinctada imbricata]|uniref:Uncharacterized protein n=1 Tax=Pinctada imbricata TaxID=66713 RepID=A0AA89BVJ2_PINIB|nr:hypothetical protein FSP39_002660 [Pinctada imbricata]
MTTHDPFSIAIDNVDVLRQQRNIMLGESQMLQKKSAQLGRRRSSIMEVLDYVKHVEERSHEHMEISPLVKQENVVCKQENNRVHLSERDTNILSSGYTYRVKKEPKKANVSVPRPLGTSGSSKVQRNKVAQDNLMAKKLLRHVTGNKLIKKLAKKTLPFNVAKPEPCAVLDDDLLPIDNMDIDMQSQIRTVQTKIPPGMKEIENRLANVFSCPEYAHDIYQYLQRVERRRTFPDNFLDDTGSVTSSMRAVLMDWFIQVQVHQDFTQQTLHMAVALVDRFMTLQVISLDALQLVGITCILIAAKFHERFPPEIKTLCFLTDNTFTEDQVILLERVILQKMDFDLNMPDTSVFLDRFLEIESDSDNHSEIDGMTKYIIDLTLTTLEFVYFVPSVIAASSLYLTRKLLGLSTVWTYGLSYYTRYSEKELHDCVLAMARLLQEAPKAKLQGARTKFGSKSKFGKISHHQALKNENLLDEVIAHLKET